MERRSGPAVILFGEISDYILFLLMGAVALLTGGLPAGFIFLNKYGLRMSDDFAAIASTVIVTIMLLGAVETHLSMRAARDEFTAEKGRIEGTNVDRVAVESATGRAGAALIWVAILAIQGVNLSLIVLWSAIDGHGPARWLARWSWVSISWALGWWLLRAVNKLWDEFRHVARLQKDLISHETSESPDSP
ncbi:hypothetical protein AB0G55_34020 [Streptomyces toyocaensis]|uniref:hypothetical protein n=1 Tax=Streptomyces toyocaensis TaxID=55952 RepID=UPI00340A0D69